MVGCGWAAQITLSRQFPAGNLADWASGLRPLGNHSEGRTAVDMGESGLLRLTRR